MGCAVTDDDREKRSRGRPALVAGRRSNKEYVAGYRERMAERGLERVAIFVPIGKREAAETFARELRIAAGITLKKDEE